VQILLQVQAYTQQPNSRSSQLALSKTTHRRKSGQYKNIPLGKKPMGNLLIFLFRKLGTGEPKQHACTSDIQTTPFLTKRPFLKNSKYRSVHIVELVLEK
jgi:hypothetical protein